MSATTAGRAALPASASAGLRRGAALMAIAGFGFIGYAVLFFVRNFTGSFLELGIGKGQVSVDRVQIQAFSPSLYHYISHLQVAVAAFIIGLGVAVIALALKGIRAGQGWALWTAFFAPVIAVGLALPLHYAYGFATLGHLGLIYLDAAILLVGTIVARGELAR